MLAVPEAIRCETRSPQFPCREGELVRVAGVFTNLETGEAIDPAVLTLAYKRPDEEVVTLTYGTDEEVVREEAGVYHVDIALDDAGVWRYRWQSGEDKVSVAEGQITCLVSGVE